MKVSEYLKASGLQPTASVTFNDLASIAGEVPETEEEKKKREAAEKTVTEPVPTPAA
jgi:hypothetical protein